MMKRTFVAIPCCLLFLACVQAKDKPTSLEDIERDNLTSEKYTNNSPIPSPLQQSGKQGTLNGYNFAPIKTISNYEQRQQSLNQFYPQQQQQQSQQYLVAPQQQQYATTSNQQQQQYFVPATQQYYYQQPQQQQYDISNQYITDNSINQHPQQQQYITQPQYVYLQQYPSSSNEVQTVVDPKTGPVQYVMYVPTTGTEQPAQNYIYNTVDTSPQYDVIQQQQQQQTPPQVQYVQEVASPPPAVEKQPSSIYNGNGKFGHAKSLLDSYVPSVLQVQYYQRQQQAQANALQQSVKLSAPAINGKSEYFKRANNSYKMGAAAAAAPQHSGSTAAESVLNYNYQLPGVYQKN